MSDIHVLALRLFSTASRIFGSHKPVVVCTLRMLWGWVQVYAIVLRLMRQLGQAYEILHWANSFMDLCDNEWHVVRDRAFAEKGSAFQVGAVRWGVWCGAVRPLVAVTCRRPVTGGNGSARTGSIVSGRLASAATWLAERLTQRLTERVRGLYSLLVIVWLSSGGCWARHGCTPAVLCSARGVRCVATD